MRSTLGYMGQGTKIMHRKHYIKAAEIVNRYADEMTSRKLYVASKLADAFVEFFENDNPQFDKVKFLDACLPQRKNKNA